MKVAGAYFGAVTLGIAEPVYNYVRMEPGAMRLGFADIVALVLVVHLGSTAVLLLARFLAGRLAACVDVLVAAGAVVSLLRQAQVIYLPTRGLLGFSPALETAFFVAIPIVVVGLVCYLRRFLSLYAFYLGVLTVFFPAYLFWSHPIVAAHAPDRSTTTKRAEPAVFIFIFDEVSLNALLDPSGLIDRNAFPNFHRFSGESVWFREAMSNYGVTGWSFASFLTGAQTDRSLTNINAMLRPTLLSVLANEGYVVSFYSRAFGCSAGPVQCPHYFDAGRVETVRRLVTSTVSVYVPPSVQNLVAPGVSAHPKIVEGQMLGDLGTGPFAQPGSVSLFHLLVAHSPYVLSADGETVATRDFGFRSHANAEATLERYGQQLQYLDRQFGAFLDGLDASGNRDKAVVVVTSDHGTCWTEDCMGRLNVTAVEPSLVRVPMMIRAPTLTPGIRDVDYQHIDLLPTVLDVLGIEVPQAPAIEGRSALREWRQQRDRRFFIGGGCARLMLPAQRAVLQADCTSNGAAMASPSTGVN
jgi:hypothetical protein